MTHLRVGDTAPDFTLKSDSNTDITLSDFKGQSVILFFYPRDNTPGCTKEACSVNDSYSKLQKAGVMVFGVSPDSVAKHVKFSNKFGFKYPLLADTEKEVINKFGIWGEKKFMGKTFMGVHRTTFIIDAEGVISHIIKKVKTSTHGEDLLELIK
jgi:peroxiredoxin Q/BCP